MTQGSQYTTAATKKSCRSKMPYMISSRSVKTGLSVSKSKLVYSSLIFVNNICNICNIYKRTLIFLVFLFLHFFSCRFRAVD